jgi:hypothetical protein
METISENLKDGAGFADDSTKTDNRVWGCNLRSAMEHWPTLYMCLVFQRRIHMWISMRRFIKRLALLITALHCMRGWLLRVPKLLGSLWKVNEFSLSP